MTASDTKRLVDFLKYSHTIGLSTMSGRGFYYPSDAVAGEDGKLYVINRTLDGDNRGVRVTVCDMDGEYYSTFSEFGEDDGQLIWPTAIAADSQGQLYVSDEHNNRITVFNASGKFLSKWGEHGSGAGEFDGPSGLAFDGDDNLYVVDSHNNRVQKYTRDGEFLSSFGSEGAGDGQFDLPWHVTVDAKGELYVADWRNDRVQRFTPDGDLLAKYGTSGRGDGQLSRPSGVAVDREGYIYVADWGNERVQVLDPEGGYVLKLLGEATLSKWAEDFYASNPDEMLERERSNLVPQLGPEYSNPYQVSAQTEPYFWGPASVTLDEEGRLYVIETNRHRFQVYQ